MSYSIWYSTSTALFVCAYPPRELVKRREMLQRVKREEMRVGMVLEAQGLERQLRDKEGQLLEVQSES